MRKFWLVLIVLFYTSYLLPAQDQDLSKVEMKVTHVAGTVYMLQGARRKYWRFGGGRWNCRCR
jgi:hypothetical protein